MLCSPLYLVNLVELLRSSAALCILSDLQFLKINTVRLWFLEEVWNFTLMLSMFNTYFWHSNTVKKTARSDIVLDESNRIVGFLGYKQLCELFISCGLIRSIWKYFLYWNLNLLVLQYVWNMAVRGILLKCCKSSVLSKIQLLCDSHTANKPDLPRIL